MDIVLIPGDGGKRCPGNGGCCDECDYQICCTKDDDGLSSKLCDKCFEENKGCEIKARHVV